MRIAAPPNSSRASERDHDREAGADRAAERLEDAVVDDPVERLARVARLVLPDPVEHHDRVVDAEADDGQHRGDEQGVDLEPKKVPRIANSPTTTSTSWSSATMRGHAELDVAEPERDPEQDARARPTRISRNAWLIRSLLTTGRWSSARAARRSGRTRPGAPSRPRRACRSSADHRRRRRSGWGTATQKPTRTGSGRGPGWPTPTARGRGAGDQMERRAIGGDPTRRRSERPEPPASRGRRGDGVTGSARARRGRRRREVDRPASGCRRSRRSRHVTIESARPCATRTALIWSAVTAGPGSGSPSGCRRCSRWRT